MNEVQRSNLRGTLSSLLERTKATLEFPVAAIEVYRNAFGEHADVVLSSFSVKDDRRTAINMRAAFNYGRVVHFALDMQRIFWIEFDEPMVMPREHSAVFTLHPEPEVNSLLIDWWHKAADLDNFVDNSVYSLYQITGMFTNRAELFAVWPELAMAVPAVMEGMGKGRPSNLNLSRVVDLKERMNMLMKADERERVVETLAKGLMLPPTIFPRAWVNRYTAKEMK